MGTLSRPRSVPRPAATAVALVGAFAVIGVLFLSLHATRGKSCDQETKAALFQQSWLVSDADLDYVGQAGAACMTNASEAAGLRLNTSDGELVAPVVVVAYNRPGYLARALVSLLAVWLRDPTNARRFPLFVSIDGTDQPTLLLATALRSAGHVQVIRNARPPGHCNQTDGYCHLGTHYHQLLQLFFACRKSPRLIFLEEDLEVAPDFFSYFTATAPLLERDASLLCISAWNDHGQRGRALDTKALYRTDVMPGLGWMLNARVAADLLPAWEAAGWDEYTRQPQHRKGRQCVFPEVARTHTYGVEGNSGGLFYREHLQNMLLNQEAIDWTQQDLAYLDKDAYAARMAAWLAAAKPLDAETLSQLNSFCAPDQPAHKDTSDVKLWYSDNHDFERIASAQLAPMLPSISVGAGIPRASYNGTVIVRCRGKRLFMAKRGE